MDLSDLDLAAAADRGSEMTLTHPVSGAPLLSDGQPVTIHLLGSDSREWRAAVADMHDRQNNTKRLSVGAIETRTIELLARVTRGWSGVVWGGEPLPFSSDNAKMLYRERPWVREQVDAFVGHRGNFFKGGSGS